MLIQVGFPVQSRNIIQCLILNDTTMDNNDLDKKKINNEQDINEGFSGENVAPDYDPKKSILKQEHETDKDGNQKVVERARNVDNPKDEDGLGDRNWDENESLSRSLNPEDLARRKVENQDRNSDVVAKRENADEEENRGNIKLDE